MAEYLKNNPVALRHSLLYLYLQENSVDEAFDDFRETVGPGVIKKKTLRHWFNQFEKGKFGDEEQPFDNIVDVLRSNKQALRACVMYEWLNIRDSLELMEYLFRTGKKRWPVLTVYDNFCEVIGNDVMKYPEFEFWFYRFESGEYGLSYERDNELFELKNMPVDIMKNIVKYLNIFDRLSLARTSQSLKTFVEDEKSFNRFLYLTICDQTAIISLENRFFSIQNEGDDCRRMSGLVYEGNGKLIEGVTYWKQALTDFMNVINFPKLHVVHLCFELFLWQRSDETFDYAIESLEMPIQQLHVKQLTLCASSMKLLLKIVPVLTPGYLTTITIEHVSDEAVMAKVVEMEQWKQAKNFTMRHHLFGCPLHHLYHFKAFSVRVTILTVEDVRQMKEILFKSPDFEHCSISVDSLDMNAIRHELGNAMQERPNTYYYSSSNSTEYFEIGLE